MKKNRILKLTLTMLLVLVLVVGMFAGCEQEIETPTPTPTPTVKPTPEPTPTVDPTPTPTPSKGGIVVTLPDNPTPSKKYVDAAGVAGLSGGGTYYLEDVTSSDVVSLANADFTGKLFIGNLDAPAKAVTVNLPKATVEVTGIVNAGAFDVTTSENTFKLNGATLNVSSLKISGGNVEIAKSTVSGAMEIPVGNTTMTKMTVTGSTLGAVTININSAIEVAMKDSPVASVTNNNTAGTTLKVSGTTTVAVENTSSAKIAVAVESGSKPSIDLKNDNDKEGSCDVQIPQNDSTAPDINVSGTGVDKIVITDEGNDTPITEITTAPAGVQFVGAAETTFIYSGKVYRLTPETNINTAIGVEGVKEIYFVGDVTVAASNSNTYVALDKPLTFNFNGKKIDAGFHLTEGSQGSIFKNGTIEVEKDKHYSDATDAPIVYLQNNGTTTIENMTLKSAFGNSVEFGIVTAADAGANAEVIVKNTTIDVNGLSVGDNINGIYLNAGKASIDGLTLKLTAKTGFNTFGVTGAATAGVPDATITKFANVTGSTLDAHLRIYLNDGTQLTAEEQANALNLLSQGQILAISTSEGTAFCAYDLPSLKTALAKGGTVKLLSDITASETIIITKTVTIDLNGHSFLNSAANAIVVKDAAHLTVDDSSANETGLIQGTETAVRVIGASVGTSFNETPVNSKFTLESGKLLGDYWAVIYYGNGAEVIINGGKISAMTEDDNDKNGGGSSISGIGNPQNGGTKLTITGGEIGKESKTAKHGITLYHPQKGTVNISGGKFYGNTVLSIKEGDINISGGEFHANGQYYNPAIGNSNGSEDTGAALSITSNDSYIKAGDALMKITVTGGTFTSVNGHAIYEGIAMNGEVPKAKACLVESIEISGATLTPASGKDDISLASFEISEDGTITKKPATPAVPEA